MSRKVATEPVNYTTLRNLLEAGKWFEADSEAQPALRDRETANVMLQATRRTLEGYLDYDACRNFPTEDLRTIDQLWLKYSNDKFGFSVQKKIWVDQCGKLDSYDDDTYVNDDDTYVKVAEKVGWKKGENWLDYLDLTFNTNAPAGHLPAVGVQRKIGRHLEWGVFGEGWWEWEQGTLLYSLNYKT